MDISQFELVYKPQAPAGPADTVLQGFFLKITNLEPDRDLQFALALTTSSVSDPDRSLFQNAAVFVDTPGTNNNVGVFNITGNLTGTSFGLDRLIFVPALGTALVAVLPSDPFPAALVPPAAADFECRGFASLILPPVIETIQFGPFELPILVSQGGTARAMITAQNRAVYLDQTTGEAKGQTQSSLPLATGEAVNEFEPLPPFAPLRREFDLSAAASIAASGAQMDDVLASLLAMVSQSDMDMRKFNATLKKQGVGMAIETRKV